MKTKYAVISGGIVYSYFDSLAEAEKYIEAQSQSQSSGNPLVPRESFKIVKVEKVYKLTKIDENSQESIYGFKESKTDDDSDYETMFDELNVYGDGYEW